MYRHSQRATWLPVLVIAALIPMAIVVLRTGGNDRTVARIAMIMTIFLLGVTTWMFSSLTITVADGALSWHFGGSLFRRRVPLAEVADAEITRSTLLEGWGIHLTTRGWLYNVSGRGAVLVRLRDGKRFMLGSDEPEALLAAIREGRRDASGG